MSRPTPALLSIILLTAGCGSPGDPQPPSLNIPERIADLRAVQRGDRILVSFTLPALTTDGVALRRLSSVELLAGASSEGGFDIHRWAAQARPVPVDKYEPGPVELALPASGWVGREVILGVRTAGPKGRRSEWSNLVALPVISPLQRPGPLQAEATAEGVRLSWSAGDRPGVRFRVFRRGPNQERAEMIGETVVGEFTDRGATFGTKWEYAVEAFLSTGETEAASDLSETASITPADRFPPATPTGLRAVAGVGGIELLWEHNREPDLRGYCVWRAADDEPLRRLESLTALPSFSDRNIQSGTRYRYAVSAVDQLGNESAPSSPVEVIAP